LFVHPRVRDILACLGALAAVTGARVGGVVPVEARPGALADLAHSVAEAGVNLDLVYVATRNRVVFGSADLAGLKAAVGKS
jgi:hypothetical protein